MNIFKKAWYEIVTAVECIKYKALKKKTRIAMLAIDAKFKEPTQEDYTPHPDYYDHLKKCRENFLDYVKTDMAKDEDRTIGIGDSILAQAKGEVSAVIDPRLNWALGGMRACHMSQLIDDMLPLMILHGFKPKNIVVGTPDGNGILVHHEIECVKTQCRNLLSKLRGYFPEAKIIVYGIPLTIVDYAIMHYKEYTENLIKIMIVDPNMVILPLIHHFVEAYHIMMKADMSSDGVHLSPKGRYLFGLLIQRAKTAPAKSFINCY